MSVYGGVEAWVVTGGLALEVRGRPVAGVLA